MNNMAPDYLKDFVAPVVHYRDNLRSSMDCLAIQLPQNNKSVLYHMIQNWNLLPFRIREALTVQSFKSMLKTYYFEQAYN